MYTDSHVFQNYIGQSVLRNELGATINCNAPTGSQSAVNIQLQNNGRVQTVGGICKLTGGAEPSAGQFIADGRDLFIEGSYNLIQGATFNGRNGGKIVLEYVV